MRRLLTAGIEALFRVLFEYDCHGEERLPAEGPAVVAANHPSYLDPILLSLQVQRPIRFMAWDALFRVPLVGALIRLFGAFPVDVGKGKGREAYARAKALVEQGEIVGIFPEGHRSRTGWMETRLREGAARLAWETGAPLYPATITGAFRAWPYFRLVPHPGRIRVRFHEPIDTSAWRGQPEDVALPAILQELRVRVERTLLPGVKADLRMNLLYSRPAPAPRLVECLPALTLGGLLWWRTGQLAATWPAGLYLLYVLADYRLLRQGRSLRWLRNMSPVLLLLAWLPVALPQLGLPAPGAMQSLATITVGATFPYLYERGLRALAFLRGVVAAFALGAAALVLAPHAMGLHVAVPLYAAVFAWEQEAVFWRYSVPVLAGYAAWVALDFHLGAAALPQVAAALLAWAISRMRW